MTLPDPGFDFASYCSDLLAFVTMVVECLMPVGIAVAAVKLLLWATRDAVGEK